MRGRLVAFSLIVAVALVAVVGTWLGREMNEVAEGSRALEPRAFEVPVLVFVGTGGSYENPLRRGPAIAAASGEDVVLVDAGRGVAEGLRSVRIPVDQVRAVYLTSLLPENTVGLDDLLLTGWLAPRAEPLPVFGPEGTAALVAGLEAAHRAGTRGQGEAFGLPAPGARMRATELADGDVDSQGALRVRAAALPDGPLPSLAYRIEAGGGAAVVGGVAWGGDALVGLSRDAGLLVHEAFFAESVEMAIEAGASDPERLRREARWRTPLDVAGERAALSRAPRLALVRLRPPPLFAFQASDVAGTRYRGEVLIPEDGEELPLTP